MTPKSQRMLFIFAGLLSVAVATALILTTFSDNLVFFYSPSELQQQHVPEDKIIRVGGLIEENSVMQEKLLTTFTLTDMENRLIVHYTGMLPTLFREGQGMVAKGKLNTEGIFIADELLAKHDENYMPPEVADSLKKAGHWNPDNTKADTP